jgi:hypothetical protein
MLKELISRRQRKKTLKGFGTAQAVQNVSKPLPLVIVEVLEDEGQIFE